MAHDPETILLAATIAQTLRYTGMVVDCTENTVTLELDPIRPENLSGGGRYLVTVTTIFKPHSSDLRLPE